MSGLFRDHWNRFAVAIPASAAEARRILSGRALAGRLPSETMHDAIARFEREAA